MGKEDFKSETKFNSLEFLEKYILNSYYSFKLIVLIIDLFIKLN